MFSLDHPKLERLHCGVPWPEAVGRTLKFIFLYAPKNKVQQHQLALAITQCPNLKQLTLRFAGVPPPIPQPTPILLDGNIHLRLESPSPANMFYFSLSPSVSLAIDMLTRRHAGAAVFPPNISTFPQMNDLRELRISERNSQSAPGSRSIIRVTASCATKEIPPLRIYHSYDPTNRSTSVIAILKALLQPLDLTGVKSVTIKAFDADPFPPSGQDPVEWREFFSRMTSLETLTIINSRASIILGALVPEVWPWREIADPDADVGVNERMVLMCPRLKEIVLGNIESPWDVEEVIELVNSRRKHGAPLDDVFVRGG